jgi:hypothetical protein
MKIRNKKENSAYTGYLKIAIDQIDQAVDSVTYSSYPELNQGVITKLSEAIKLLEACTAAGIFKP